MTCGNCGATWKRREARFCGRCGAVLETSAPGRTDKNRSRAARSRWRAIVAAIGAVALVTAAVAATVAGVAEPDGPGASGATPSLDVELPEQAERRPPPPSDEPRTSTGEPRGPALTCEPEPCQRWHVELNPGSTVVDDAVYHVGRSDWRLELTALALADGSRLWSEPLAIPDTTNGEPLPPRPPQIIAEPADVIVVAAGGLLQARSRTDGRLVWEREVVSVAGRTGPGTPLLVLEASGDPGREHLVALDLASGRELWRRDLPRDGFVLNLAGSELRVERDDGSESWDVETGEVLSHAASADGVGDRMDVERHGRLLVHRRPHDHPANVGDREARVGRAVILDARDGTEILTAAGVGGVPVVPLPSGGIVIVSGTARILTLTVLDDQGELSWEREFGIPQAQWPRWPEVTEDGSLMLLTSTGVGETDVVARRLDPRTGGDLSVFPVELRSQEHDQGSVYTRSPVVVERDPTGTHLHGPAGVLELSRRAQLLTTDPLIVATSDGAIVRLDERLVLGGP